jgi:hypothetical protein
LSFPSSSSLLTPASFPSAGTGAARIFYRHVADLAEAAPAGGGLDAGASTAMRAADATRHGDRVFKFGVDTQADFELWSKTIRSAIDGINTVSGSVGGKG